MFNLTIFSVLNIIKEIKKAQNTEVKRLDDRQIQRKYVLKHVFELLHTRFLSVQYCGLLIC
jgi:hypothetical protein